MTTTGSLLSLGPVRPIALNVIVIPFLTDLLPKTVGAQDTIIQVVLSARGAVMRDKTGLTRYSKNLAQIRHDPQAKHNRYNRTEAGYGLRLREMPNPEARSPKPEARSPKPEA